MSHSDAAGRGDRDHLEPAQIDVAGDEIGRRLQKCLQVLRQHVGVKTFGRTPILVNKPDIGIIDGAARAAPSASLWPRRARKKARFVTCDMEFPSPLMRVTGE